MVEKLILLPALRWGWVFFKSRVQNDVRRFGRGLAGLFSLQILLNLIKRCSNQHAEIVMNETNMRRFEKSFHKSNLFKLTSKVSNIEKNRFDR